MQTLELRPVCADPLLFWAGLIAAFGFACGSGGQSFDDGSGDLGRGKRSRPEVAPHSTLAEQPSTLIRAPFMPDVPYFDSSSGFVGDLDGDGYADLALVAWEGTGLYWDPEQQRVYVFYGREQFPAELDTSDADFVIAGAQGQLTPIGDFNGDGFDDFGFVGEGWQGAKYRFDVLLGGAQRRSGTLSARSLETSLGAAPMAIVGDVAGPGDVNGDGYADLLLGASLVLGRAEPYGQTSFAASANRAALLGGSAVQGPRVGDLDGDGDADLLVDYQDPDSYEWTTRLYYGRADWGSSLEPLAPDASFAGRVRSVGDWDGDGHGDLARVQNVPTWNDPDRSQLSELRHDLDILYGSAQRFAGNIALPPAAEVQLTPDALALGDVNGDSRAELILGAPLSPSALRQGAGAVFLLANTDGGRPDELRLTERDAALQGRLDGDIGEQLGRGVSSGGDANGDGYADVLVVQQSQRESLGARLIFGGQGL